VWYFADTNEPQGWRARNLALNPGQESYNQQRPSRLGMAILPSDASGGIMPESSGSTPPAEPRPDPNEQLVKVFDTEQESEALVVKGLLDSVGIDSDMTSVEAVQDMFPGVGGMVILVREEDAERARDVIEQYRRSPVTDDETAEVDLNEDTPTTG